MEAAFVLACFAYEELEHARVISDLVFLIGINVQVTNGLCSVVGPAVPCHQPSLSVAFDF